MAAPDRPPSLAPSSTAEPLVLRGASIVQLTSDAPAGAEPSVEAVGATTVVVTQTRIAALERADWSWLVADLDAVRHARSGTWTILEVPGVTDHGIAVRPEDVATFRSRLADLRPDLATPADAAELDDLPPWIEEPAAPAWRHSPVAPTRFEPPVAPAWPDPAPWPEERSALPVDPTVVAPAAPPAAPAPVVAERPSPRGRRRMLAALRGRTARVVASGREQQPDRSATGPATLDARSISAWFGDHQVLDRVSLTMDAGQVTALIGPSGCGKSTFLRILNRMHEMIPAAAMAGEVLLDGQDVYDAERKLTDARRQIGMVFQKPNPFPAMSIYDNVVASLRLTGTKADTAEKDALVEGCLMKAGLWNEVRDRLRQPGGSLSGGQQQRLCIARALAIRPLVLLMDEPCSALDPTSTRRIEQTIAELAEEVTIVIVTHNMQQALRVSHQCAFFLAEHGTPGVIVEHGPTDDMFHRPQDPRTDDYVNGRFG